MQLDIKLGVCHSTLGMKRRILWLIKPLKSTTLNILLFWRWILIISFWDFVFLVQVTISHVIIAVSSRICIVLVSYGINFELLIVIQQLW